MRASVCLPVFDTIRYDDRLFNIPVVRLYLSPLFSPSPPSFPLNTNTNNNNIGKKVGGMLFILDDVSSFLDKDMFVQILVANAVGTFCLAYYKGDLTYCGAINFGSYTDADDDSIILF